MAIKNFGLGAPKKASMPPPPFGGQDDEAPGKFGKSAAVGAEPPPPKEKPPVSAPGGGGSIAPEAVCYRSEVETCANCQYNSGGNCDRLSIPVSDGDGCNLFEDKGGDMGMGDLDDGEGDGVQP